jgi:hypothetical protein
VAFARASKRWSALVAVAFVVVPVLALGADIVELQPFKGTSTVRVDVGPSAGTTLTLIDLNPEVGEWFVLDVVPAVGKRQRYHLENSARAIQSVSLDARAPESLVLSSPDGVSSCNLLDRSAGQASELEAARGAKEPFVPICGGRLYVLNQTVGHESKKERAVEFLRSYVWGGERLTSFAKQRYFRDSEVLFSEVGRGEASRPRPASQPTSTALPLPALLDAAYEGATGATLQPADFGLELEGLSPGAPLLAGAWHRTAKAPDVFFSLIEPRLIAKPILSSRLDRVNRLDGVEAAALTYLVAFDLDAFEVAYALGTEHPRVTWAPRTPAKVRDSRRPGPDGLGTIEPLASTGMVPPSLVARVTAAFTAGFKREHGAFVYGPLAEVHHASHYGFITNGVVFSTLQPGLATVIVRSDGDVELKTWTPADDASLSTVRHARQNGVALIDTDAQSGAPEPGPYVNQWGAGNWSGSVEGEQRALRAGLCLQETEGRRYLIYGYFSSATPSAMARVFQAYHCQYALHLDMNALEHTYLALYHDQRTSFAVEHLITGMSVLDAVVDGHVAPRFVAGPDNRDFFYLWRKGRAP